MFEDLFLGWRILLSLILLGFIFNNLGRNTLSAILAAILIWAFVLNGWVGFSIMYFIYLFFIFQGIFLIQGIIERQKAEKMQQEMQLPNQEGVFPPYGLPPYGLV